MAPRDKSIARRLAKLARTVLHCKRLKLRQFYGALILPLFATAYPRAREALLRKFEADTRLKELEVEERQFQLDRTRIEYGLSLVKKLPQSVARDKLGLRVSKEIELLQNGRTKRQKRIF